ncbi:MAG: hypothetical protein VB102_11280 [Paludibacter sp.]|nr:hypothetical protein [Paludibacter sp.]
MDIKCKIQFETDETVDSKPRNRTSFIVTQQRLYEAKKILNNLKIDWEFDINKMNFENLRDSCYGFVKNYNGRIETRKIDIWYDGDEGDPKDIFYPQTIDITLDLIEFVQTGKKVIPPIAVILTNYSDGEKICPEIILLDGFHRLKLARYLGETEIPLILFEDTNQYKFTKGKWTLAKNTDECKVSSLSNFGKTYTFKNAGWVLNINEFSFDFCRI